MRYTILTVLLLIVTVTCSGMAQQAQPAIDVRPPGTVDGSQTPDQIPDSVAYRMLFRAVAEPLNATPQARARFQAKLQRAQLSDSDLAALFEILGTYDARRQAWEQAYKQVSQTPPSANTIAQFAEQRDAIVQSTRTMIAARLSSDGLIQLDRFVQAEKRRMIMAPMPTMPMK